MNVHAHLHVHVTVPETAYILSNAFKQLDLTTRCMKMCPQSKQQAEQFSLIQDAITVFN